jgi:hypothetical protein
MAAAAAAPAMATGTAPVLIRFDSVMNNIKSTAPEKFVINIDVNDNTNKTIVKYIIQLFKYNINSKSKIATPCNNIKEDYHSIRRGENCPYIGFFDRTLVRDDFTKSFFNNFYSNRKTTWFLDYNIIDPTITVENITEENYYNIPFTNINVANEIKKVLYSKSTSTNITDSALYGNDVTSVTHSDIVLPGEHIVINNIPNPVFTLDSIFTFDSTVKYDVNELNNITTVKEFHFYMIKAFFNRTITFKFQPPINTIKDYNILVKKITYINTTTNTNTNIGFDPTRTVYSFIDEILETLKNNTIDTYVSINSNNSFALAARADLEAENQATRQKEFNESIRKRFINFRKVINKVMIEISSRHLINNAYNQKYEEYFNSGGNMGEGFMVAINAAIKEAGPRGYIIKHARDVYIAALARGVSLEDAVTEASASVSSLPPSTDEKVEPSSKLGKTELKYLKYKQKYLALKNKLNLL